MQYGVANNGVERSKILSSPISNHMGNRIIHADDIQDGLGRWLSYMGSEECAILHLLISNFVFHQDPNSRGNRWAISRAILPLLYEK